MREERVQIVTRGDCVYLSPKRMLEHNKTLKVGELIDFLKKCDRNLNVEILVMNVGYSNYYPIRYVDVVNEEVDENY